MGINFNGQVTINGNVEMYDNGSMKITANQLNISINDLPNFIEENLKYSPNKLEYLEAAETVKTSNEPSKIKEALNKLGSMAKELGKNLLFIGLSQTVIDVIKGVLR
ncbi:hypothetical protein KAW43_01530 [Candidatus Parcubacteria bacterium]|nr:hypothetical protein [Candidatus Parcubacteria bacterium]